MGLTEPGVETEQPAKTPNPRPQVGVGLERKTLQWDCFTVLKRQRKSRFNNSDCCFGMSLVPADFMMSKKLSIMSRTAVTENDSVWALFRQTHVPHNQISDDEFGWRRLHPW